MDDDVKVTDLGEIEAPWGKVIRLQEHDYAGGMALLRMRIREGKRFTDLDLDPDTVGKLADAFKAWIARQG